MTDHHRESPRAPHTVHEFPADRRAHERRVDGVAQRVPPRLDRARQLAVWVTLLLLVASGALWLYAEHFYAPPEGALEPYVLKNRAMQLHGAAALLFLLVAGSLLDTHIRVAWRRARNRASGVLLASVLAAVAVSGYGLWYFNGDTLRDNNELVHWIAGFGMPLLLLGHWYTGRKTRPA